MSLDRSELEEADSDEQEEGIAVPFTSGSRASRRKFIVTNAAIWSTATLAGCNTQGQQESTTEATTEATPTPTPTPEPPTTYVVSEDLLAGSDGIPKDAGLVSSCSPTRTFMGGMLAVWHVGVYDPATGDPVTNDTIDSMVVSMDDGTEVKLQWAGDDEEHAEPLWKGSWEVPKDAAPGTVKYSVDVTGSDANYRNVEVAADEFSIIESFHPKNYVVTDELLASGSVPEGGLVSSCGTSRGFAPGMTVVFHIGVYDPATGESIDDGTIQKMVVDMSNDVEVEMTWAGDAEEHAEPIWKGSWEVPKDAKEQELTYEIKITDEEDNFRDVDVEENTLSIVKLN